MPKDDVGSSEFDPGSTVPELSSQGIEFKTLLPVIGLSAVMFALCMTWFGISVKRGDINRLFAPRSWARPKGIIKNQISKPYALSWIPWALKLSYSEMLEGVEGTGTRNGGWSGVKLKANLDGIILIKFVNLCLKVSVLATVLCIGLVLPVNFTATCDPDYYEELEGSGFCTNFRNLTTFEKTTLANIPEIARHPNSTWYSPDLFKNAFGESTGITMRMLTTMIVCFCIYGYACVLIWEEWIQNLALRRVYYLEYNHYERRKAEIEYLESLKHPEDENTINRPVFVVHPEYRDTVPNIGLYSVLFRLPFVNKDGEVGSNSDVGRQLQAAIEFFDKVVPNQPGFSSSIAALTILPDVQRLSMAWNKWFRCASKVRRLKFIRKRLAELRKNEKLNSTEDGQQNGNTNAFTEMPRPVEPKFFDLESSLQSDVPSENFGNEVGDNSKKRNVTFQNNGVEDVGGETNGSSGHRRDAISADDSMGDVLRSAALDVKQESNMEMFLNDDEIEQEGVYYREYARSSATCGPNGCDEYAILHADIITLEDLEQEAAEEVSIAIDQLHKARDDIRAEEPEVEHFEIPEVMSMPSDCKISDNDFEPSIGIRDRTRGTLSDLWEEAEALVGSEQYMVKMRGNVMKRKLNRGSWGNPFDKSRKNQDLTIENAIPAGFFSRITRHESYAVVTFTSRQAAIAARQCLSDGSGLDGWREVDRIPIPPLADAVPWNICDCRGCCRPVTLTLPSQERRFRFKMVVFIMIIFSTCWTYPFYVLSGLTSPAELEKAFSAIPGIQEYAKYLSPWLNTAIMIGFFALLPQIFKMLANFSGEATSIQEAERHALTYYWWFMLVFVFGGRTLGYIIFLAFRNNEVNLNTAQNVVLDLARVVPTSQSFYWMTWMITQTGIILPFMYFLQFNNFMFTSLNWDCCARATAGGGPGGIVPYRVYVNSGVIFLCVVALAPLCPVLAPFSTLYFLFIYPLLKWGHIFVYRPTFDAGGMRWPLLHNILMNSIIVSQFLLSLQFLLKKAYLLAIIALVSIIFTWTFKSVCKETFGQSYNDAALLQTSELDGWKVGCEMPFGERERYRKWVVDCHKASYVPVCVNAEDDYLSAEPAVVIPTTAEMDSHTFLNGMDSNESRSQTSHSSPKVFSGRARTSTVDSMSSYLSWSQRNKSQRGAIFRRVGGEVNMLENYRSGNILEEPEYNGSPDAFPRQFATDNISDFGLDEDNADKML